MSFKVQVGPPEISIHQGQTVLISATGDRELVERHLGSAEACLSWIDKYGDGFQEYQTRSPVGYENMGWKDSGDSVVYPDGTLVKGPKALCELQGYVYDAWVRIGKHKFSIHFRREGERTEFEVFEGEAKLVERCRPITRSFFC